MVTFPPSFPVIDAHAHLGAYGSFRLPHAAEDDIIATLDRCGISLTIQSHDLALAVDVAEGNRRTLAVTARHPGRVAGYWVVDPHLPAAALERELAAAVARPGIVGLKFHTSFHDHPFSGPGYRPALEFAEAHALPVLTHGWEGPAVLEQVAGRYPHARFILAHAGAAWNGRDAYPDLEVAARQGNVWVDICGSGAWFGALPRLVERLGAAKILWGTDAVWFDPGPYLYRVLAAPIEEDAKRLILGGNAGEVFHMECRSLPPL